MFLKRKMIKEIHPSEVLRGYMRDSKMSVRRLAKKTGLPRDVVKLLVKGELPFSPGTSKALEKAFKIDGIYWVNLQAKYDRAHGIVCAIGA